MSLIQAFQLVRVYLPVIREAWPSLASLIAIAKNGGSIADAMPHVQALIELAMRTLQTLATANEELSIDGLKGELLVAGIPAHEVEDAFSGTIEV
jgi:hypothetical protein